MQEDPEQYNTAEVSVRVAGHIQRCIQLTKKLQAVHDMVRGGCWGGVRGHTQRCIQLTKKLQVVHDMVRGARGGDGARPAMHAAHQEAVGGA